MNFSILCKKVRGKNSIYLQRFLSHAFFTLFTRMKIDVCYEYFMLFIFIIFMNGIILKHFCWRYQCNQNSCGEPLVTRHVLCKLIKYLIICSLILCKKYLKTTRCKMYLQKILTRRGNDIFTLFWRSFEWYDFKQRKRIFHAL